MKRGRKGIQMLNIETRKHIDGNEFWELVEKLNDTDKCAEGKFNEIYNPPQDGSVRFWIPTDDELEDEEWYIKLMVQVLLANGFHQDEIVYIDVDY